MSKKLRTTGAVIDALGGTAALSRKMRVAIAVVSNWRAMEKFPAHTYLALKAALKEAGKEAPDELWRMVQPRTGRRTEQAAEAAE